MLWQIDYPVTDDLDFLCEIAQILQIIYRDERYEGYEGFEDKYDWCLN